MAQIYICPECGCPDLETPKVLVIVSAKEKKAHCPNCKWEGSLADAAGILTTENVYDTKAVLDLLLYTTMKHAAGPIAQALIFVGLLDQGDQLGMNVVMRAAIEGLVKETFEAAAAHAKEKKMSPLKAIPFCPECGGSGALENELGHMEPCPRCGGAGRAPKQDKVEGCGFCNGDAAKDHNRVVVPCENCGPKDAA
jgi:hypothetical protein